LRKKKEKKENEKAKESSRTNKLTGLLRTKAVWLGLRGSLRCLGIIPSHSRETLTKGNCLERNGSVERGTKIIVPEPRRKKAAK